MARSFKVPINLVSLASDPASAAEGDVYYNSTDDRIRVYKNSTWVNLAYADDVGITSTDYITFDTTPESTIPATAGTVSWDSGESGLNVTLNSNVDLKMGQENVVLVGNQTGSTIDKGKVVYINGASGQRPTIALSDADTEATSSKTLGLTAESIASGAEGFVTTFGVLRGVNTDGLTEGAALWLSSTAGGYTTSIPAEPAHSVFIGYVVKAHISSGEIFVNPQNGYELNELHGVQIEADDNIADNEVLAWDDASGLWKNQTSAEAGLIDTSSTAQSKSGNFTAPEVHATTKLVAETVGGDEGGEILLGKPATNTTIAGTGVTIDVWQNKLRFFEQGGDARGYYIDITGGSAGVGTNLVGGGATSDSFKTISVSGQSDVVADSSTDTLTLVAGSNVTITTNATSDSITIAATDTNTVTNAFTTISTPSGTSPVADSTSDTLTLTAGTGITITGNATTDSITIASTITDTNTTYDLTSTGTSIASINLVPSSGATDSITITGSGATTVSHSAGAITISSTDTNTTYSAATSTTLGLIELFSDTVQSTAANSVTSTASRTYGVQVNSSGQAVVNVPWTDTDTTYTAGTALDLSGTTFNLDLDELATSITDGEGDYFVVVDSVGAQRKLTKANINISGFNGDSLTLSGDLAVNGGDITTTNATATLFNTNATTLSIGGAATIFNIGTASNTNTTINIGPTGTSLATINIGNAAFDTAINIGTGVGTASDITIGNSTYTTLSLRGTTTIDGNAQVGSGSGAGKTLTVYGAGTGGSTANALNVWGSIGFTGDLLAPDGSASDPSYTFDTYQGSGMYMSAANVLGFSANNTEKITIGTNVSILNAGLICSDVYSQAVTSARTVLVNSNGRLGTSASTRRVKSQIEDITSEIKQSSVLELDIVKFKYNADIAENGENAQFQLGFIAEQAQDLGLDYLYLTDSDGIPDYFVYEKLSIYLLAELKNQKEEILYLKQRLDAAGL